MMFRRFFYKIFIYFFHLLYRVTFFNFIRIFLLNFLGASIKKSTFISRKAKFDFPWRLVIGSNCYISDYVYFDCRGGNIIVGDNVDISLEAIIFTATHDIYSDRFDVKTAEVEIGNRAWICARTIVLPGSRISKGVVVGANSVISGYALENSLYQGVPAIKRKELSKNRSCLVRS